jgi:hypothetical protein
MAVLSTLVLTVSLCLMEGLKQYLKLECMGGNICTSKVNYYILCNGDLGIN